MKEMILSDHIGDMLRREKSDREDAYKKQKEDYDARLSAANERERRNHEIALDGYETAMVAHEARATFRRNAKLVSLLIALALGAAVAFLVSMAVGVLLGLGVALVALVFFSRRPSKPKLKLTTSLPGKPQKVLSSNDARVWSAGEQGENNVADALKSRLDDGWTLMRGYRNGGGEIDQLVVGPMGVCAIEVKYINGSVYAGKEHWTLDKYDNYGNLVETEVPIKDRGGRSPSAQLNGAASRLERFLSDRAGLPRVRRAVVLSHHKSEVEKNYDPSIDSLLTLEQLKYNPYFLFANDTVDLDERQVTRLVNLINRDYNFHQKRRNRRQRGNRHGAPRRKQTSSYRRSSPR